MTSGDTGEQVPVTVITAEHKLLDLRLREVWQYRDLIWLYARRSIVAMYKQTILGPLWLILNPLITSLVYLVVFGNIAGLSTQGVPQIVFYFMSNAAWTFFASTITVSSDTFVSNSNIFGKVYFPRLTIPLSNVLVALLQFAVQLLLGLGLGVYFMVQGVFSFTFAHWVFIPLVLLLEAVLGVGFGIIASSLTTRYRDLRILVNFGVRLWMFITPVVYPLSQFSNKAVEMALLVNPVTAPVELMRWCMWGTCDISVWGIVYSCVVAVIVFLLGIMLFNRVERTFMDTV